MTIHLVHYQRPDGQRPLQQWLLGLRDPVLITRITTRLNRLADGNFGDVRPLRAGILELRLHSGPGYRIYLGRHGLEWVILLAGGNKSTQDSDIALALTYWHDWKARLRT